MTTGTGVGNGWQALADHLRRRRLELGYRSRAAFVAHLEAEGETKGAARIVGAVENAERDNYRPETIIRIEGWYDLPAGTVNRIVHHDTDRPTLHAVTSTAHKAFVSHRHDDSTGRDLWTLILPNGAQASCSMPAGATHGDFLTEIANAADDIAWSLGVTPSALREAATFDS